MKIRKKTLILSICGALLALVIACITCADIIISDIATRQVQKRLAEIDTLDLTVGDIDVFLVAHMVNVQDITFNGKGVKAHVPQVTVGPISYKSLWKDKTVSISRVKVSDADLTYADSTSKMTVEVDSADAVVHDIRYCITDSSFAYNDSVYSLSVGAVRFMAPDGLSRAEVHNLSYEDNGPVKLGYTRFCNTLPPAKLADLMQEPTTWVDVELNSLTTSPINPWKMAQSKKQYELESLSADVRRMHVYRDVRYKAKHPFPMPQSVLMAMPVRFEIHKADAVVHMLDVEFASTNINCGKLRFYNMKAALNCITNIPKHTFVSRVKAAVGEKGTINAKFAMHMTRMCNFDFDVEAKEFETARLNTFVRPLVGMTFDCHIDKLSAAYSGDSVQAAGQFTMLYHGLKVQVHKEDDIPYKVVTKNAKTITTLANTLIPKSNPTAVDVHPRSYKVEAKRDIWQQFPLYLFMPIIDGVKETMLPGLYVHKQVHEKKSKK